MSEIKITGDVYAKSPEEFKQYKIAALAQGYKGREMSDGSGRGKSGRGQYLTLEAPRYERKGKCGYCNSLISIYGIFSHDRKCENCGKVIYRKYERGGLMTFYFRNFNEGAFNGLFTDVTLRIHSFNIEQHILRFEMAIPRSAKYGKQRRKRVLEIMEKNKDAYNIITIGKKKVYSFYYPFNGMMNELTRINTSEVRNSKGGYPSGLQKCKAVQILDGKEYSDWASYSGMSPELPMPTSFHIYRDWKVEKSAAEIARRAGLTSRPEYYSGRQAGDITSEHLVKMYKLIKEYKGDSAAENFKMMIEGTHNMAATVIMKRYNKLEANGWKWSKDFDEKPVAKKESNIAIDMDNPAQIFATFNSIFSGGRGISNIFGGNIFYMEDSIKQSFLNSIK